MYATLIHARLEQKNSFKTQTKSKSSKTQTNFTDGSKTHQKQFILETYIKITTFKIQN